MREGRSCAIRQSRLCGGLVGNGGIAGRDMQRLPATPFCLRGMPARGPRARLHDQICVSVCTAMLTQFDICMERLNKIYRRSRPSPKTALASRLIRLAAALAVALAGVTLAAVAACLPPPPLRRSFPEKS